jgi:predicted  nucleic acid-binding Zn-ribbon protein
MFEDVDTGELLSRYSYLIEKYADSAKELAYQLDKFGKMRNELQFLSNEFISRGLEIKDPEKLIKVIEEELNKYNAKKTDTP